MFLSTFATARPLFYDATLIFRQKRYVWFILSIIFIWTLGVLSQTLQGKTTPQAPVTQTQQPIAPTASTVSPAPTPPPTNTPATTPSATSVQAAVVPNCTPPRQGPPAQIDLANKPVGLTYIADATDFYQVFGNTATQIKTQLRQCPAIIQDGNSFGAVTNGRFTWQYLITPDGSGNCRLSDVKVGLRTNMLLPKWVPTVAATNGLATQWQRLISNLETHENGHITIYHQSAKQLLSDLQALPVGTCDAVAAAAIATTTASTAALNAAHKTYDNHTDHGVEQGAVLR